MIRLSPEKRTFVFVVILIYCLYNTKISSNFSNPDKNIDKSIQLNEKNYGKKTYIFYV